ncbi:WXG100 family type VII secretion target [Streptomyces sp. NA04227]|uniref:WXG100 family type VII secretion target n=1 Tax=Streptomyces sp. NA04227 TaxID=2742136 RepID=UPI001592024A|nr:WXG100 family type VII secretion target [Streptomyces sp. NA04227]QKW09514.1 WXG100 family type VII secretion target [Streptomyces sp. NA04227]
MVDKQSVSDQEIREATDVVTRTYDDVRKSVHNLNNIIDGIQGAWEGVGARAFQQKQNEINSSMVRINHLLEGFLEAIAQNKKINDHTEDLVRSAAQKVEVSPAGQSAFNSY